MTFSSNIISTDNIISLDPLINRLIVCPHFAGHLDFRHSCIDVCSDDNVVRFVKRILTFLGINVENNEKLVKYFKI